MKKLLFALFMACSMILNAQYLTTKIGNENQTKPDGILYFLPKNVIRIELGIKETRYYIGPYAEFTQALLGTNDYIKTNKTEFEIQSVDMTTLSQPDQNACFNVSYDEKSKDAGSIKLSLTDDGVLKAFGYDFIPENCIPQYIDLTETKTDIIHDFPDITFIDIIENQEDDDSVSSYKLMSKEDKARVALEKIEKTRTAYYELVSGFQEVAYGNTIVNMAEMLKNIANEYVSLFKGKKISVTYNKVLYIIPDNNQGNSGIIIAKLSETEGFGPANAKNGKAVKLQFETKNSIPKIAQNSENNTFSNKLISRIPAITNVKMLIDNDLIFEKPLKISQFGCFAEVPANNYKIIFNPNTGQVISLSK